MAVKIRLARHGAKKRPYYRIVVADSRSPRDGRFIEEVGRYNPCAHPHLIQFDMEKVDRWIAERLSAMADLTEDLAGLTDAIVRPLIDEPDVLDITAAETEDGNIMVEIRVAADDAGKVIGRQGRVIKSIRTLARAAASKSGKLVDVELID